MLVSDDHENAIDGITMNESDKSHIPNMSRIINHHDKSLDY